MQVLYASEPIEEYNRDLLYKEESYEIVGICMDIHRELGRGFNEIVYKDAMELEFRRRGLAFEREKKYEIEYKGVVLPHSYYADFVYDQKIIVEVKAQQHIIEEFYRQTINYLAASKLKLGLILNFGEDNFRFKRVVL